MGRIKYFILIVLLWPAFFYGLNIALGLGVGPLTVALGGISPTLAALFLLFPVSQVYTWVFYRTGRSILAAILFHFFINFFGTLWEADVVTDLISLILWTVVAMSVIVAYPDIFRKPISK